MPVYDYECSKCNQVHEVTQKFSDAPLSECPDEGCKGPVKKLLSLGSAFSLKGTGFYTTDYKRAGTEATPSTSSPATAAPSPAKSAPKKSDS